MTQDEDLEAAIDSVGRERVFALSRDNGWSAGDHIPKWVWWGFVRELQKDATDE